MPGTWSDAILSEKGIDAALVGDHARARELLNLAVQWNPGDVQAWLWLSRVAGCQVGKTYCLQRVLALESEGGAAAARRPARPGPQAWERERARLLREAQGEAGGARDFSFILALGLLLLSLITLEADGLPTPLPLLLPPLRVSLGLGFVLFVPGYALQAALFPRPADLDGAERLTLSFGLSVVVAPFLALILDQLPWGIRPWPVIIGGGLTIAILSAVALLRRWRLPAEAPSRHGAKENLRGWWVGQDRIGRLGYSLLAMALLLAAGSAAAILLRPKAIDRFTEFYILGADGLIENYPRETVPGLAVAVTAGITNREGQEAEYRVVVKVGSESIGGAGPLTLQDGASWEASLEYALPQAGDDQHVEFLLYRDSGMEPYRRLSLWIDVVDGGRP
jgi:uncharacterized membrane protein